MKFLQLEEELENMKKIISEDEKKIRQLTSQLHESQYVSSPSRGLVDDSFFQLVNMVNTKVSFISHNP